MVDETIITNQNNSTEAANGGHLEEQETMLYDLSILIETGQGDDEFVPKIVGIFIDIMPDCIAEIKDAAKNKTREEVRKAAHKMKSSIDLLGVHSLQPVIRQLESITDDDATMDAQINALDSKMQKVIAQLKKAI